MMWIPKSFIQWKKHWIKPPKAAFFIFGLILSHGFVENAILAVWITHLEDDRKLTLPKAAQVVNIYEGFSAVMVILAAYVADVYLGCFGMTVLSATALLIVLVVLYFAAKFFQVIEIKILYGSLAFMILAKAGRDIPLKAFLADQFRSTEPTSNEDDKQVESRGKVWWRCFWFLGVILATAVSYLFASWKDLCFISAIAMGCGFLSFLLGIPFYNYKRPTGSALTAVLHVLQARILRNSSLCTPDEMNEVKRILTMIPMWSSFVVFGLVDATGKSLFLEQFSSMNSRIGKIGSIPPNILLIIQSCASFMTSYLCDLLLPELQIVGTPRLKSLLQIGCGMICSMLCSITAWSVENLRRKSISNISVFWLTPQFAQLGFMEGFATAGLDEFFTVQVSESMRKYGPRFNECAIGTGKFISAILILIFKDWFRDDLNSSHLDRYYAMLGILSFLNLFLFGYWANRYDCLSANCNASRDSFEEKL